MAGEQVMSRNMSVTGGGMTAGGGSSQQISVDNINTFQKIVPSGTVNGRFIVPITLSTLKGLVIVASKACTIKTNSTSDPDDTLTMVAGVGRNWFVGDPDGNKLLTANVTDIYVTVTNSGEAPLLKIIAGSDSTPVLGDS